MAVEVLGQFCQLVGVYPGTNQVTAIEVRKQAKVVIVSILPHRAGQEKSPGAEASPGI